MTTILELATKRSSQGQKSIAVLIDPDKIKNKEQLTSIIKIANENYVDYFFVGGSLLLNSFLPDVVGIIKSNSTIPVLLFPGSNMQIDKNADALLFLSLISGRNPDLLIGQHVVAAPILKESKLEVISTGYLLIDGGSSTSVVYMSNTIPIPADKYGIATSTALAGEMLGNKFIYLDAGSGAINIVNSKMVEAVKSTVTVPVIVGGGINSAAKAMQTLNAGADIIVIGNAIEKTPNLLIEVSNAIYDFNKSLDVH